MEIKLDDSFDTHWIYVNRFQKTSFNIIARAKIDYKIMEDECKQALQSIEERYPYLCYSIDERKNNDQSSFFLTDKKTRNIQYKISPIERPTLNELMVSPSQYLQQQLDIESGEQMLVHFWVTEEETVIELVCAHLVGDVDSILLILKDLLNYIEKKPSEIITPRKRLGFDEIRYGWKNKKLATHHVPIPEPSSDDSWPNPKTNYNRFNIPLNDFKKIKPLIEKNDGGSIIDYLYFLVHNTYKKTYKKTQTLVTIQSFRKKLTNKEDLEATNTSAVFCSINTPSMDESNPKTWIKQLNQQRKESIETENIINLMNFLRCLNKTMHNCTEKQGMALLGQLMPTDTFAFNNFGNIDNYLTDTKKFRVIDIDIQDAAPGQEVRIYSFDKNIHIAPMLYDSENITPKELFNVITENI